MQVSEWSCEDVKKWLVLQGFEQYCILLCDTHGVDGEVLLSLSEKVIRHTNNEQNCYVVKVLCYLYQLSCEQ